MPLSSFPATSKLGAYMRVSSEEQRDRQTIENQREAIEKYAAQHSLLITDVYADDPEDGKIALGDRPEGRRLIQDVRAGRIDLVTVYKIDRLGRNTLVILSAVEDLIAAGATVVSVTQDFDFNTPPGKMMLANLAGMATFERDLIVERSRAGSDRLARQGVWLGGIVPYGYRVHGQHQAARLEPADDPIPGLGFSEADVVRMIFAMTVEERKSCVQIANRLNNLQVPTAYARDGREVSQGKRRQATAAIWRPSRIRAILINSTYKGLHEYGKHSAHKQRELIAREVPALVPPAMWDLVKEVLQAHLRFSDRNARRKYLLRGLIKCGLCGLTYIGVAYHAAQGGEKPFYVCNGKHQSRGLYGERGEKCPSQAISGDIEDTAWADIEEFIRDPGAVVRQLAAVRKQDTENLDQLQAQLSALQRRGAGITGQRDRILGLFRRGIITDADVEGQLQDIKKETDALQREMADVTARIARVATADAELQSVEALLRDLNARLDAPVTWELKRQLVELLVQSIRVDTIEEDGIKQSTVHVTYRFSSTDNDTGRGCRRPRESGWPGR